MNSASKVVVIGSTNTDLVVRTDRLPSPGETLLGSDLATFHGGKGANQAVACARMGASVTFVARIGNDEYGKSAKAQLAAEGIDVRFVTVDDEERSGVALIVVDSEGQNSIVVASGANNRLAPSDIELASEAIKSSNVVVLQLETPQETVAYAAKLAHEQGKVVILNPAPAPQKSLDFLRYVSILVPNESELMALTGEKQWSNKLLEPETLKRLPGFDGTLIVTLGERGSAAITNDEVRYFGITASKVVDTTAAGDCFTGALACLLAEGTSLELAIRGAEQAAAVSVARAGAQSSLPYRHQL